MIKSWKRIKQIAIILAIVLEIAALAIAVTVGKMTDSVWLFFGVLLFGTLVAFVCFIFIYAYGDLVESSVKNESNTAMAVEALLSIRRYMLQQEQNKNDTKQ